LPVGVHLASASRYEGHLLEPTLDQAFNADKIRRVIADKGYDDDKLRGRLAERGIDLIVPNKGRRVNKTQDLRKLRRYKHRWIVERTFAWLHNYRRLVTRWERLTDVYLAFLHLGCILITLKRF